MQAIQTLLSDLDRLYCSDTLTEYEQILQTTTQQVEQTFPGFTIALAEIYTAGPKRQAHGGMRHVLMPKQRSNDQ
jgi:hypothetical protein